MMPYFLCIWAKLEMGSKMGDLLFRGRDVCQETAGSAGCGRAGARANCIAPNFVLHCAMEARNDRGIWKSEASV